MAKKTKKALEAKALANRKLAAITAVKKIGHLYPVQCAECVALIEAI